MSYVKPGQVVVVCRLGEMIEQVGWHPHEVQQLCFDWDNDVPTAEIGRRLNRSTNSVIGKAHRLGLPERPSPLHPPKEPAAIVVAPERRAAGPDPLPAGHPISAGAIGL